MKKNDEIIKKDFFIVLCKQKKKIVKYFKLNRIRKKVIIDVKKMADEEGISYEEAVQSEFFKVLLVKKINDAIETKKDIYYIPYFNNEIKKKPTKILNIKKIVHEHFYFNLLCLYDDFDKPNEATEILKYVEEFDFIQLLKDY